MNYQDYQKKLKSLEEQIDTLKEDYLEKNGIPIGTPVVFLGKKDGWKKANVGKLHHVARRTISWDGEVVHDILPAKKNGAASKKGSYVYFCRKKDLEVVNND